MTDIVVFMVLCLLAQIAILRIWLNSELFSAIQDKLTYWRESKRGIVHYICYLLTCWQCLGVWVSWGLVFPMAIWLPNPPIKFDNYFVLIVIGLGIALVSEIIEYYFLVDMDTPKKRVYDYDHLDIDPDETVINNEEDKEDASDREDTPEEPEN